MGKKSAPPAPDYVAAAQQQGQSNLEANTAQTWANRPNLSTPWGDLTWTSSQQIDPATGKPVTSWSGNVNLTPAQQAALDSQQRIQQGRSDFAEQLMGTAKNAMGNPIDWNQMDNGAINAADYINLGSRFQGDPSVRNLNAAQLGPLAGNVQAGVLQRTIGGPQQQLRGSAGYGNIQNQLQYDPTAIRAQAQSAVEQLQKPELEGRRAALQTQLANQGITQGSEAYDNAMREQNDAESRAQLMAIAAGRDEANQLFGQELQSGQFSNQAQAQGFGQDYTNAGLGNAVNQTEFGQGMSLADLWNRTQGTEFSQGMQNAGLQNSAAGQQYAASMGGLQFENQAQQQQFANLLQKTQQGNAEAAQALQMMLQGMQANQQNRGQNIQTLLAKRNQPLNEMNAFLTGQQVQMPQFFGFNSANRTTPGDIQGAMDQNYQNQLDSWGAGNAQRSQTWGAIGSAIATYLGYSDRRLKKKIKVLFTLPNGIEVCSFQFIGKNRPELGVIAQQVLGIMPEAVIKDPRSGYYMVDYSKVLA